MTVAHAERTDDDLRALTLLLDLEYLQAEFYLRAATGEGLRVDERGAGAGVVSGGRRVSFSNPFVAAFVENTSREERDHVAILREIFLRSGEEIPVAPAIDLDGSFAALAYAAGVIVEGQAFDPFANDTNLLFAAFMFEDVAVSAYQGALLGLGASRDPAWARLAALTGAESCQAAVIRSLLLAAGLSDATNAVAYRRQVLCGLAGTHFQGNDHGVGTLARPTISPLDDRSLAWGRTTDQCLAILCGNPAGADGLFFPEGLRRGSKEGRRPFIPVHLDVLAQATAQDPVAIELRAHAAEAVALPAIRWHGPNLAAFTAEGGAWPPAMPDHYRSVAPRVLEIRAATSIGAVGIVRTGEHVVSESLWHTDPQRHRYVRRGEIITFHNLAAPETLPGTTVSILTGAAESYWHSLVDATLRLALIDEELWRRTDRLLLPATGVRQAELAALSGVPEHVEIRSVRPDEVFDVETLILPSSLHGVSDFHPALTGAFFDRALANAGAPPDGSPKRLYVDRRGSPLRRLVNETELIAALPGFEPVQTEGLSIAEQAHLFAGAEIIVAPHGAGLSNIGFARPGTIIVEMMMDTYPNWCFRRLAAARGLPYSCVIGRALDPEKAAESVHLQSWSVDVGAVVAAVEEALQETREAVA